MYRLGLLTGTSFPSLLRQRAGKNDYLRTRAEEWINFEPLEPVRETLQVVAALHVWPPFTPFFPVSVAFSRNPVSMSPPKQQNLFPSTINKPP